jgi:hypothetical protein
MRAMLLARASARARPVRSAWRGGGSRSASQQTAAVERRKPITAIKARTTNRAAATWVALIMPATKRTLGAEPHKAILLKV